MKIFSMFIFITAVIIGFGCTDDSGYKKYEALMKTELASGKKVDSLFMGVYFGMSSKKFFTHCWDMNKKGLFTDGSNNNAVLYKLNHNELKFNASMNFYPEFYQDKIYRMRASFNYDGWAPWNKQMAADSLYKEVVQLYRQWYPGGNEFITVQDKKRGIIDIKVDGNRRIIIGRSDDMHVKVDYADLLTEQQLKK